MDSFHIRSWRDVCDIFESLYRTYSSIDLQQLPRFKKQNGERKSKLCQSSLIQMTKDTVDVDGKWGGPSRMLDHQTSFSSAVVSMDPDAGNLLDEADAAVGTCNHYQTAVGGEERLGGVEVHDPSEADSGFTTSSALNSGRSAPGRETMCSASGDGMGEECALERLEESGFSTLAVKDMLFMMHKPRLKRKRGNPLLQNRKLDPDDLWLKGQHRWRNPNKEESVGVGPVMLFLNRNLRRGRINLDSYVCTLRKSRTGRKHRRKARNDQPRSISKRSVSWDKKPQANKTAERHLDGGLLPETGILSELNSSTPEPVILTRNCVSGRGRGITGWEYDQGVQTGVTESSCSASLQSATSPSHSYMQSESNRNEVSDTETENGEIQEYINLIDLPPRRVNFKHPQNGKHTAFLSERRAYSKRGVTLWSHRQAMLGFENSEWGESDLPCQPLFGQSNHCGGIWNCILEESLS